MTEERQRSTDREPIVFESVDDRMISLMRLILALSALLIIYIDPAEPNRFVALTYAALIVYSAYSAVLYGLAVWRRSLLPNRMSLWIDVASFVFLVALSSGTNSIFFYFFFFAILVAAFRFGFRTGSQVLLASAVLFTVIGYATAPSGPAFELNRFLLRPVYLLVLGYMIAYWGGNEIRLKRRLGMLREITAPSSAQFSVSQAIGSILEKINGYYAADDCWLILSDLRPEEPWVFRFSRGSSIKSVKAERLPLPLATRLLAVDANVAVVHRGKSNFWRNVEDCALEVRHNKECTAQWTEFSRSLAIEFEIDSFITVPLQSRGHSVGRLYLIGQEGVFEKSDIDFLKQVVDQTLPVIQNIRLLDRLASNAAEHERQRLARDIHDSVIQRYLGLQYKLAAIRNKSAAGVNVERDIDSVFQMTVDEVSDLRGFAKGLTENDGAGIGFISSLNRFARQFADNYNLEVEIESKSEVGISDRLAAELIQIIHEGLSNIRKHTEATNSKITIDRFNGTLSVSIGNNDPHFDHSVKGFFVPRSITERAEELGGQVAVEQTIDGWTLVQVHIPL